MGKEEEKIYEQIYQNLEEKRKILLNNSDIIMDEVVGDRSKNYYYEEVVNILKQFTEIIKEYDIFMQNVKDSYPNLLDICKPIFTELNAISFRLQLQAASEFSHYTIEKMQEFDNLEKKFKKMNKKVEAHDKNVLNMMGIFLAIFSLIGINISFFTGSLGKNLEICEFLKYLVGVNLILVIAIMTVFEMIKRYTKE